MLPRSSFAVPLAASLLVLPGGVLAAGPAPGSEAAPAGATTPTAETAPAADAGVAAAAAAEAADEARGGASAPQAASDTAGGDALLVTDREAEFAKIAPRLAPGDELQWLAAAGRRFLVFQRKPRQGPPKGAILIVPAPQELVDQRELTRSLRTLPPTSGFVTLALQPPLAPVPAAPAPAEERHEPAVPAAGAQAAAAAAGPVGAEPSAAGSTTAAVPPLPADFCPRVTAALAALEAAVGGGEMPLLAIAATDASVPAVLGCYAGGLPAGVRAFAAIGRWQGDFGGLAVPSIEFVPARDPVAVKAADERAALPLAAEAPPRRRVDLDGVDVRLEGAGEDVAKRLRGWLERLPPPAKRPVS